MAIAEMNNVFGDPAVRHIPQVLVSFIAYQIVGRYLVPFICSTIFGHFYRSLNYQSRIKWDLRVVSLVHSCLVTGLAWYVIMTDQDRRVLATCEERTRTYLPKVGTAISIMMGYGMTEAIFMARFPWAFVSGSFIHVLFTSSAWLMGLVRTIVTRKGKH
jgi:hypothetical protein